jgi:arylsulfatase A-like enzyme
MQVLVVVAGGLHLGYVGCYGNAWVESPALDRLAAEGVVFDQHFADYPDAAGARRSWRTGSYHFPVPGAGDEAPLPKPPDLLQALRERGVVTALVSDPRQPLPPDFAAVWAPVYPVPGAGEEGTSLERELETVVEAIDHLSRREDWLLWVELATLLPPWRIPEEFSGRYLTGVGVEANEEGAGPAEEPLAPLADPPCGPVDSADDTLLLRLQRTYAGAVTYLDRGLALLFEELRGRDLLDGLLVVVTTDRGVARGEHGLVGEYRPWLHDELTHLPLILRLPGGAEAGRRVSALTQPVDLLPTLLDALGVPAAPAHGHSLLPLTRGEGEGFRAYACSGLAAGGAIEWSLRTREWAFLLPVQPGPGDPPRPPQLYVKPDDRGEVNNVLQHHLELADELEKALRGFVKATRKSSPLEAPELRVGGPATRGRQEEAE